MTAVAVRKRARAISTKVRAYYVCTMYLRILIQERMLMMAVEGRGGGWGSGGLFSSYGCTVKALIVQIVPSMARTRTEYGMGI